MFRSKIADVVAKTALLMLITAGLHAGAPQLVSYQGRLTNALGQTVPDGPYDLNFRIYDAVSGGNIIWHETHNSVQVSGGVFSVLLGSAKSPSPFLDASMFSDTSRWLGVTVGIDPEISQRTRLTSVPYSLRVATVDGASGGDVFGDVTLHSTLTIGEAGDAGIIDISDNAGQKFMTLDGAQRKIGIGIVSNITAQVELDAGNQTALEIANTGTGEDYAVHAHNWNGTAGGFYSGPTGSGWPENPTAVYGRASLPSGVGGLFSSALGSGVIAHGQSSSPAFEGWATGTGRSGYFHGGAGVLIDGSLDLNGNLTMQVGAANGHVLTSDALGTASWQAPGVSTNDWSYRITDGADTSLVSSGKWGIARAGSVLLGPADSTHVNLGIACTTGVAGNPSAKYETVAGGYGNSATGQSSTVAGGYVNKADHWWSTIGGGRENLVTQLQSTIPGGYADTVRGSNSTAIGSQVRVNGSNCVGIGFDFTTSATNAVVIGGANVGIRATAPNTALDVDGDLALRLLSVTLANGGNNDAVGAKTFWRIAGPTAAFSVTGIANGQDGRMMILYNSTSQAMTISNESASSTAANRILTMTGANIVTVGTGTVTLIYSSTDQRWIVTSFQP